MEKLIKKYEDWCEEAVYLYLPEGGLIVTNKYTAYILPLGILSLIYVFIM